MSTPYLPHNPSLKQSRLRQLFEMAPKDAINLGLGQPGEDTPGFIREAAERILSSKPLGYTLNAGILPLREKLAAELADQGVTPDRICVTAGVQEALYALFYAILDAKSEILLPNPGFFTYASLADLCKAPHRGYDLSKEDNFRFNADLAIAAIRPETTAILVAHPSNPSGSNASREELQKLVEYCKNRPEGPIWIVSDEVYYGMSYTESASLAEFIAEYPYIVLLRGASKSHHMTGWRLGWAVLPKELAKPYIAVHQYVTTCVSSVTQFTFNEIRGSKEEAQWLVAQKSMYKRKRDMVFEALNGIRPLYGGEGAFYWLVELTAVDLNGGSDDDWVVRTLMEDKIMTTPGSIFGSNTDGMIRISYGPTFDVLADGLTRLKQILQPGA
jgi:aspartate/methionine/tyrosine aminotransferase